MARRTSPTLTAAVDEYQEVRSMHLSPKTLQNDGICLRSFARAVGEGKQVHTITPRVVEGHMSAEARRMAPSSYNKLRSRLASFFAFCVRRGWLDTDPLGEVRPRKVVKRERLRLSPAELLALPTHARTSRDRAMLTLLCNTALRASEVSSLRVADVDLGNGLLRVRVHKSSLEDQMPITAELDVALREWFVAYEEDAGALQPDWFLFPTREPGKGRFLNAVGQYGGTHVLHEYGSLRPDVPMTKVAEIVKRALSDLGHTLTPGEGAHTIRRSVARAFFDHNVARGYDAALRATSALLHHSSTQVTEGYLGLSTEKLHRDDVLKGQSFLGAMVDTGNVTPIRKAAR